MSLPGFCSPGRFRGTLLGRAQRVFDLSAQGLGEPADGDARKELLGELHTLKGESRMLGLTLLSTLAHALEDALAATEIDHDALLPVLDSIVMALSEGTPDDLAHQLLTTGLHALGREELAVEFASTESDHAEAQLDAPKQAEASEKKTIQRWIQVDARVVEELCEGLATLETEFGAHIAQIGVQSKAPSTASLALDDESQRLRARLSDCLLLSLNLRLTPLEPELQRLGAHVRRTAAEKGCATDVVVQANGVQVEREVLELMSEPLIHLANNAVEHGVLARSDSQGARVTFWAENVGTSVVVRVEDNGPGIDTERVWERAVERGLAAQESKPEAEQILPLIFRSGFSTRDAVDQGAGRGVGLDVVQRQVKEVDGHVQVESRRGEGSSFILSVPAALTRVRTLVVRIGPSLFGMPVEWVEEVLERSPESSDTYRHAGITLPRRSLSKALRLPEEPNETQLLLLRFGSRRFVVSCHHVIGHNELIRRPTSRALAQVFGVSANSQLDDGRLVLMLDRAFVERGLQGQEAFERRESDGAGRRATVVLVVDDSVIVRDLIREVLVEAGYQVETAADGISGLEHLDNSVVDLVLSDIEMPRMDGFGFLTEIRKRSATLPVVMLSAKSSNSDRLRASSLGASAYVTKREFESNALVDVVRRYSNDPL